MDNSCERAAETHLAYGAGPVAGCGGGREAGEARGSGRAAQGQAQEADQAALMETLCLQAPRTYVWPGQAEPPLAFSGS